MKLFSIIIGTLLLLAVPSVSEAAEKDTFAYFFQNIPSGGQSVRCPRTINQRTYSRRVRGIAEQCAEQATSGTGRSQLSRGRNRRTAVTQMQTQVSPLRRNTPVVRQSARLIREASNVRNAARVSRRR